MAYGWLNIPFPGGLSPSVASTACGWKTVTSSGGAGTNGVVLRSVRAQFDQSTDEHWLWQFTTPGIMPASATSSLWLHWGADVTSGNVIWKCQLSPMFDAFDDTDSWSMATAELTSATAVPGTSGQVKSTLIASTVTLNPDTVVVLMLGRDADNGSDTAAGDAWLVGANWVFAY